MLKRLLFILPYLILLACQEDEKDLPSVDDRINNAREDLIEKLSEPTVGWRLDYQPTNESGSFLMILSFDEDGNVTIRSDLSVNDGAFFEQENTYRIDFGIGTELIFESYGVLHYLFELDQGSFGGEFEFYFIEENEDGLLFSSKTDLGDPTFVQLREAQPSDIAALSQEIDQNFSAFSGQAPRFFGGVNPSQQLYLSSSNISVFWEIDLSKRTVLVDLAGIGQDPQSIFNGNFVTIGESYGYTFVNGSMVFAEPIQFTLEGENYVLETVGLDVFSADAGPELCPGNGMNTPEYSVLLPVLGPGVLSKSLINGEGAGFAPQENGIYTVNIPFIFDDSLRSLAEEGSIANLLPEAVGFLMTYGLDDDSIPENGVGFIVEDALENTSLFLRSFDVAQLGNQLTLTLLDDYYYESPPTPQQEVAMEQITNEIFEGGTVYAFFLPFQGLTIYQFYNPCNQYEFLLVQ